MENGLKIYTDGGARGNPGPAASAFVVYSENKPIHKESLFLGKQTNNQAEYNAIIIALEWILKNQNIYSGKKIEFYSDSELIVRQITGLYRVKDDKLKVLSERVNVLKKKLNSVMSFSIIPREKNKIADGLVNQRLDVSRT